MLHPLPTEVVQKLRSGIAITSVLHCVDELVINAIDAGATCIAVRLNLPFYKIQVIDNGNGIDRDQMEFVGLRYATSKCHSLDDLQNQKSGGFRGEALASLKDMSSVLTIESRTRYSENTYSKIFTHGRPPKIEKLCTNRPSIGTTVIVHDFMYNMPVRRQCISETLDLEDCRKSLEKLALIYPQISFSLRSDTTGEICLESKKCDSIMSAFRYLFGREKSRNLKEISLKKEAYEITGLISTDGNPSKDLQLMYVNKRHIHRSKLQKLVSAILKKFLFFRQKAHNVKDSSNLSNNSPSKSQTCYSIFVLNVACPRDEYDLVLEPRKTLVEFVDWEKILKVLEEAVIKFLKDIGQWQDKESFVELSVENDVSIHAVSSDKMSNFPFDLGKAISAQDNKNALFSVPAKRAISTHTENAPINPLKKLFLSHGADNVPIQTPEITTIHRNNEELDGCISVDTSSVVSNESKSIKNNKAVQSNFKSKISNLNFLNIPEKEICLKEISKIMKRHQSDKLNNPKAKFMKQANPMTTLRQFEFNVCKHPSKPQVEKKNEATQTEKHVSINPVVQERCNPTNVSKYTFNDISYLEPLKHLKLRKATHLKSALVNKEMQGKHHKNLQSEETSNQFRKPALKSEKIHVSNQTKMHKVNHNPLLQNYNKKSIPQFSDKKSIHPKRKFGQSRHNRVYPVLQEPDQMFQRSEEFGHRKFSSPTDGLFTKANDSVILLRNRNKVKPSRRPVQSHNDTVSHMKDDVDIKRHRSFPESRRFDVIRKQSSKTLHKNPLSYDKHNVEHTTIGSSSGSLFSQHSIDDLRKKGRAILNSPAIESTSSKHREIVGMPIKCKNSDFLSKHFRSPVSISDRHWLDEKEHELNQYLSDSVSESSGSKVYHTAPFDQSTPSSFSRSPSLENIHSSPQTPEVQNNSIANTYKTGIWKEIPDSPPSAEEADGESSESDFNLSPDRRNFFTEKTPVLGKHSNKTKITSDSNFDFLRLEVRNENTVSHVTNSSDKSYNVSPVSNPMDIASRMLEKSEDCDVAPPSTSTSNTLGIPSTELTVIITPRNSVISEKSTHKKPNVTLQTSSHWFVKSKPIEETTTCGESTSDDVSVDPQKFMESDFPEMAETEISTTLGDPSSIPLNKHQQVLPQSNDVTASTGSMESHLQSYLEEREMSDRFTKWKVPQANTSGNIVEDMFSSWENPMFQRHDEVESVNSMATTQKLSTMYAILNSYRFSKKAFASLKVIGQVDQKFIACLVQDVSEDALGKRILVFFDQHAAHERVRLEELMAGFYETDDGGNKQALSSPLSPPLEIELSANESRLVNAYSKHLKRLGITLSPQETESAFQVHSVPICLLERANNELKRNRMMAISSLVKSGFGPLNLPLPCLCRSMTSDSRYDFAKASFDFSKNIVRDWVILLEQTRNPVTVLPKTLTGILNSQACKGAIKFGDPLDRAQCVNLLEALSACKLPFQCAHGRPSLAPLLDLEKIDVYKKKPPPQLKKLSTLMRES